ncbi:MAG TPA: Ada metal-binding domain-containing protein [Chitinophagales bacterium]|nr:Ada metal-binding domain-containing protein [Chitinophagales bacterium]HRK29389.1 Ada metal-binding domain-containing protein [Chitinophagales bacterium]
MYYRKKYPDKKVVIKMVKEGVVKLAGCYNSKDDNKTYGNISTYENGKYVVKCRGGRSLLKALEEKPLSESNQVFFTDEIDALENGYRPCSLCFPELYKAWKAAPDKQEWAKQRLVELKGQ